MVYPCCTHFTAETLTIREAAAAAAAWGREQEGKVGGEEEGLLWWDKINIAAVGAIEIKRKQKIQKQKLLISSDNNESGSYIR